MLYEIHRNMFKNIARPDHHYFNGNPTTSRDPPNTGKYRPPKSSNRISYNKSKNVFEKTTKTSHETDDIFLNLSRKS